MGRIHLTALVLAGAMLATTGCGGSGKGLSRAELIAKADPICRHSNERLILTKVNRSELPRIATEMAALEHQTAAELARLSPPSSMAADWKVVLDGFQRAGNGLATMARAAKGGNVKAALPGLAELSKGQELRAITASRDGFNDCGKL